MKYPRGSPIESPPEGTFYWLVKTQNYFFAKYSILRKIYNYIYLKTSEKKKTDTQKYEIFIKLNEINEEI